MAEGTQKETKATVKTVKAPAPEVKLTLEQKLVEIRKTVPYLRKENKGDVKYNWVKADDVWVEINPKMNELGVNFRTGSETNVKLTAFDWKIKSGIKNMFIYESDLELIWINAEDPEDRITKTVHAIAWQDDPAKAKGSAMTYAVKYDLFSQFSIPMGDMDPDNFNHGSDGSEGQIIGSGKPQESTAKQAPKQEPEVHKTTAQIQPEEGVMASIVQRRDLSAKIDKFFKGDHAIVFKQLRITSYEQLTRANYNKMMKIMEATIKEMEGDSNE